MGGGKAVSDSLNQIKEARIIETEGGKEPCEIPNGPGILLKEPG